MNVNVQAAIKPIRKLRKLLRDFPAHPTPEEVHHLRIRARRVEAAVHALAQPHDPAARRLLNSIKPLRKAAGKVRDMDVLFGKLCRLSGNAGSDAVIQLGQHLSALRQEHSDHLHRVIIRRGARTCRMLKQFVRDLERDGARGPVHTCAAPQILANQLEHWPRLHSRNLHEFRVQAKELRYMLQLSNGVSKRRLQALDETKDIAGEWHDWVELRSEAEDVLDPQTDREILQKINAVAREKLHAALTAANRLRDMKLSLPRAA